MNIENFVQIYFVLYVKEVVTHFLQYLTIKIWSLLPGHTVSSKVSINDRYLERYKENKKTSASELALSM